MTLIDGERHGVVERRGVDFVKQDARSEAPGRSFNLYIVYKFGVDSPPSTRRLSALARSSRFLAFAPRRPSPDR